MSGSDRHAAVISLAWLSGRMRGKLHPPYIQGSCLVCQTASLPWIETEPTPSGKPKKVDGVTAFISVAGMELDLIHQL